MQVGSVNSNVATGQQQPVKKSNAKRTAAYIGAGIGTAAAITGAIVYRKNIANAFKAFKDMLTPLKTTIGDNMSDIGAKAKDKAGKVAQKVKNTVDDGVEVLKEQAAKGKEHHHCNHQHAGTRNDLGTFTFGEVATEVFLILFTLRNHEGRDDWREVKGENHDGNPQPDSDQDTVMTG